MNLNALSSKFRTSVFALLDWEIWVLLAIPLILLLVTQEWIFTNPYVGFIDPWIYLGYFLDLPGYLHIFSNTYYATRLSWILPGFYLYQLFPPVVANYLLHLLVYYASTISLYLLLKLTLSRRLGLIAAILMGFYPPFLSAAGWDYPDGIGIAYFLLTMVMLTCASRFVQWKRYLCLGGFLYGALIYTNLYWLAFTPTPVIHFIFMNHRNRKHSLPLSLVLFLIGILLVTVVLGIFNYTHNRNFLFFYPTIQYLMSIRFSRDVNYYDSSYQWIWTFPYFHLTTLLAALSFVFLVFRGIAWIINRSKLRTDQTAQFEYKDTYALIYQVHFLLFFVIMVLLEFKGWPSFQYFYYASSIIPCMFLGAISYTRLIVDRLTQKQFLVILLAAASFIPAVQFDALTKVFANFNHQLLILAACLLLVMFLLRLFKERYQIRIGFLALFIAFLILTSFNIRNSSNSFKTSNIGPNQDGYIAVIKSVKAIRNQFTDGELRAIIRQGKRLFWYDINAPLGGLYTSITSVHLWAGLLVNYEFPSLHDLVMNQPVINLMPDTKLLLLASGNDVMERANAALKQIGLHVKLLHQEHIQSGKVDFTMLFVNTISNIPNTKS